MYKENKVCTRKIKFVQVVALTGHRIRYILAVTIHRNFEDREETKILVVSKYLISPLILFFQRYFMAMYLRVLIACSCFAAPTH